MCMFLNEYRSLFADFLWFKFCTSAQICIYLPTFVLIQTLCNRCCPTERYIRTVRVPGYLVSGHDPDFRLLQVAVVGKYVSLLSKRLSCAVIPETFGIEL